MSNAVVAVVAIIVSGIVGPALTAWWTRQRQRADHLERTQEELQAVLDEAAQALGRGKRAYERIYAADRDGRTPDACREAFEERRLAMQQVRYAHDRIAMRFGTDSPVYIAYARGIKALDKQRHFARSFERGQVSESSRSEQRNGHAEFDPARSAFVNEALVITGRRSRSARSHGDRVAAVDTP